MPGVSEKQSAVSRFLHFHRTREDLRYAFALIYLMTDKKTAEIPRQGIVRFRNGAAGDLPSQER